MVSQLSLEQWRESRAVGGDCSRLFGVWLEIDFLFQISSCFFLFVRRSVAVSSPGFRRFAALAQAVLGYGGCLSSVLNLSILLLAWCVLVGFSTTAASS